MCFCADHEGKWRSGGVNPIIITSALDEYKWSTSSPGHFIPVARVLEHVWTYWKEKHSRFYRKSRNTTNRRSSQQPNSLHLLSYPGSTVYT